MNVFIMIGKVKEVLSDNKNDLLNKDIINAKIRNKNFVF